MNNLTQKQKDAKADILQKQLTKTLEIYKKATPGEKIATIKHIDAFLETLNSDQKNFWLKIREKLETMNEVRCADQDTFNTIFRGGSSSPFLNE